MDRQHGLEEQFHINARQIQHLMEVAAFHEESSCGTAGMSSHGSKEVLAGSLQLWQGGTDTHKAIASMTPRTPGRLPAATGARSSGNADKEDNRQSRSRSMPLWAKPVNGSGPGRPKSRGPTVGATHSSAPLSARSTNRCRPAGVPAEFLATSGMGGGGQETKRRDWRS